VAVGWLCTKAWASCGSLPGSAALRPLSAIVVVLTVVLVDAFVDALVDGIAALVVEAAVEAAVGAAVPEEVVRGLLSNCKSKLDVVFAVVLAALA
jgi:hypothetical protein